MEDVFIDTRAVPLQSRCPTELAFAAMPRLLPAGPYRMLTSVEGHPLPYYVIPFDADGQCTAPQTRDHLLQAAGGYTDIFLFSHGWNNDWTVATERYEHFIQGVQSMRRDRALPMPPNYRPLLVGIFWPSQALEWFDAETGPGMAAVDPGAEARQRSITESVIQEVAASLPIDDRPRFRALAQSSQLDPAAAEELAAMLARATRADDEDGRPGAPSALDLLAAASSLQDTEPDYDGVGTVGGAATGGPKAAFGFGDIVSALDPRNLLKPFTVWQMKDRAGKVGYEGVAPLLIGLLANSDARVHLLGHSYGCKVVMTALCSPTSLPRPVSTALLMQPAISQYAFAHDVPDRDQPGGFVKAAERVRQPIIATFSEHDFALRQLFHRSVRRSDDLGELQYAGEGDNPSRYAAMGGYGPQASQARFTAVQEPGDPYDLAAGGKVLAVNGSARISGHGDISNPATWWMSYQLSVAHLTNR